VKARKRRCLVVGVDLERRVKLPGRLRRRMEVHRRGGGTVRATKDEYLTCLRSEGHCLWSDTKNKRDDQRFCESDWVKEEVV